MEERSISNRNSFDSGIDEETTEIINFSLCEISSVSEGINLEESHDSSLLETSVMTPPKKGRGKGTKKSASRRSIEACKKPVPVPLHQKAEPLTKDDVKCPICFSIFIEPVTFPCFHSICFDCYKQHVEKTSLQCPLCRFRLSIWSRKMTKTNTLINFELWRRIQHEFPREEGADTQEIVESPRKKVLDGVLAKQGEIHEEFDRLLKQHSDELERVRLIEEEATLELIKKLEDEEGPLPLIQLASDVEHDLALAKKIQDELDKEEKKAKAVPKGKIPTRQSMKVPSNQKQIEFLKISQILASTVKLDKMTAELETAQSSNQILEILDESEEDSIPKTKFELYEEDLKLAKKLQKEWNEEEKKESERQAATKGPSANTRGSKSAPLLRKIDRKRVSPFSLTTLVGQEPKRCRKDEFKQIKINDYFTPSSSLTTQPIRQKPSSSAGARPPSPGSLERSRSNTPDSINTEFSQHFQPIVRPPKTPPKVNPDGTVQPVVFVNLQPKVNLVPRKLIMAFAEANNP